MILLYCVLVITRATTGSRRTAFYIALTIACVWAGASGFHELRGGFYDSVALCLLVMAMSISSPVLVGICAFAAAWTDERALIALPLIFLFVLTRATMPVTFRAVLTGRPAAIPAAAAAYCASRMYWTIARSLLVSTGGVTPILMTVRPQTHPITIFTSLGGGWLMVVFGLIVLVTRKHYRFATAFCGALLIVIAAALCVADRTRSLAYCLPAVFVGMSVLGQSESGENVEVISLLCCLISLIVPLYYFQEPFFSVAFPLPVEGLRLAARHL
jgi:hypothetical protein